jgi:WD40 repeat protein
VTLRWVLTLGLLGSFSFTIAARAPQSSSQAKTQTIALSSPATSGALSPGADSAALVGGDKKLRLWNLADGHLLDTIELSTADIDFTAVSPGGRFILTGDHAGNVALWNTETGKSQIQLRLPHAPSAAAFSADGSILAIAPASEPIQFFDIASGRKLWESAAVTGGTISLAFSRDGASIASADTDTVVRIRDAHTGKLIAENRDFLLEPLAVDFTADGKQVIAAGADKIIAFIDASTGKMVRKLAKMDQPVSWSSLKVSPDGAHFATVCMTAENLDKPRPVEMWSMATGQRQTEWMPPSIIRAVGWTHDGRLVSVGGTADSLLIWRIQ